MIQCTSSMQQSNSAAVVCLSHVLPCFVQRCPSPPLPSTLTLFFCPVSLCICVTFICIALYLYQFVFFSLSICLVLYLYRFLSVLRFLYPIPSYCIRLQNTMLFKCIWLHCALPHCDLLHLLRWWCNVAKWYLLQHRRLSGSLMCDIVFSALVMAFSGNFAQTLAHYGGHDLSFSLLCLLYLYVSLMAFLPEQNLILKIVIFSLIF